MSRARGAALAVGTLAILAVTHAWWLGALGRFLVVAQEPEPADAVAVLAGDRFGNRVVRAGDLVRQGLAPYALVSGPPMYATHESELAIELAAVRGFSRHLFVSVPNQAESTVEEAQVLLRELARRNARSVMVVTSDYHTGRAGRIWRKAAPGLRIRLIAARDKHFEAGSWWRTREGCKVVLLEWSKTLSSPLGI